MAEPTRLSEILLPPDKVVTNADQRTGRGGSPNRPRAIRVNRPYLMNVEGEDWPFYLDFTNDEKLTASPTEKE